MTAPNATVDLTGLRKLQQRLREAEAAVEAARGQRNAAILAALAAGVSVQDVADTAQLSRAAVYYMLEDKQCAVNGCTSKVRARGLCHTHYTRDLRKRRGAS
jgi:hypothetical protein